MKKLYGAAIVVLMSLHIAVAQQNVGVNTLNPQATLDVKGNHRFGGNTRFLAYDSVSGRIIWNNSSLFVANAQYLIQHSSGVEGLYYSSGQIEYRNPLGNATFYINHTNGNGYFSHRLGIANSNPQFPLSLNGDLGDKISLWTDGTPTHYGFGIQGGLFQMFAKTVLDDIAFGYGNSSSFNEVMRIKGSGNVGIGVTDPQLPLDIEGRIRSRGTNPFDPGIWLFEAGADRAFIGLENNNYVGFYGNQGAGWKFAMNTQSGALKVNGSEGNAGQVIQSNGAGSSASWGSATNQLFNNVYTFGLTSDVLTTGNGTIYNLPGLNQTINLAQTSKVIVSIHAAGYNNGCFGCGEAIMEFRLSIDGSGNHFVYKTAKAVNGSSFDEDSGIRVTTLAAGNHNFNFVARHNANGDVNVYRDGADGYGTRMTIIVVPQ